ncbi:MAG: 50S ribosomal protein L4 [bacterium]|nr:50S ribosomal protein L4 [bacterium]
MPTAKVYNAKGEKVEDLEFSDAVFNLKENNDLLHQAYITISGNQRQVLAHTKDRGERAGSGKKPWRQKGTGNARAGSVRSPLWRKGGVTFGPTKDKNFKRKINKKMMKKAILIALSGKVKSGSLLVLEKINLAKKKTAEFASIVKNLKIKGSILIGFCNTEREFRLFSRNIEKVTNILTENLNVFDMLNNKYLILSKESIKYLEEKYKNSRIKS